MKFGSVTKYNNLKTSYGLKVYKETKADFYVPKSTTHIKWKKVRGSCGTMALSTILRLRPETVSKYLPKTATTWSDREMKKMLNRFGWEVKEITVTAVKTNDTYIESPITKDHILLLGQRTTKHEGTWAISYQNVWIHNFEKIHLSPLEFINNPIMSVYIICRKKTLKKNLKRKELLCNY